MAIQATKQTQVLDCEGTGPQPTIKSSGYALTQSKSREPPDPYFQMKLNLLAPRAQEPKPAVENAIASEVPPLTVVVRIPSAANRANTRESERVTGSADCAASAAAPQRKRRRTELSRKEECEQLRTKLAQLQSQLALMQKRPAPQTTVAEDTNPINASATTVQLEQASRELHQCVAGLRCMMSLHLLGGIASPVHPYVHLLCSMEGRRRRVLQVRPLQLQFGHEFIDKRSQFLDLTRPHVTSEWYVSHTGEACGVHLFIDQLHGVYSVERVFAVAVAYTSSYQVAAKKSVSVMTYHSDDDPHGLQPNSHNSQFRLIVATPEGPIVESNTLLFSHFDPHANSGIVVATYVDKDDLRPFAPATRLRQDVTAVLALSASPVGVVVRHWVNVRTHFDAKLVDAAEFGPFARRYEAHNGHDIIDFIRQQLCKRDNG